MIVKLKKRITVKDSFKIDELRQAYKHNDYKIMSILIKDQSVIDILKIQQPKFFNKISMLVLNKKIDKF